MIHIVHRNEAAGSSDVPGCVLLVGGMSGTFVSKWGKEE